MAIIHSRRSASLLAVALSLASMASAEVRGKASVPAGEHEQGLALQRLGVLLLHQMETAARDTRYHAGELETYDNYQSVSRWSHLHHADHIQQSIEQGLKPALEQLERLRPYLGWREPAFDKLFTAASELAAADNSVLGETRLRSTPTVLNLKFSQAVKRVVRQAGALVKASSTAGEYAASQVKAAEGTPSKR